MGKILSKTSREALLNPLNKDNPVLVQVLGICSALFRFKDNHHHNDGDMADENLHFDR